MIDSIRVFVADDHALFRDGLHALFDSLEDIDLVGEAENGQQAVDGAAELQPDVVLMDIQMPGMNGIGLQFCRSIDRLLPVVGLADEVNVLQRIEERMQARLRAEGRRTGADAAHDPLRRVRGGAFRPGHRRTADELLRPSRALL
ncbi:MAG: response regulator transcription factor [Anaerolineales bacterium]